MSEIFYYSNEILGENMHNSNEKRDCNNQLSLLLNKFFEFFFL